MKIFLAVVFLGMAGVLVGGCKQETGGDELEVQRYTVHQSTKELARRFSYAESTATWGENKMCGAFREGAYAGAFWQRHQSTGSASLDQYIDIVMPNYSREP